MIAVLAPRVGMGTRATSPEHATSSGRVSETMAGCRDRRFVLIGMLAVPLGWLPYLDQYCYPRLLSLSSLDALLAWHPSPIGESG